MKALINWMILAVLALPSVSRAGGNMVGGGDSTTHPFVGDIVVRYECFSMVKDIFVDGKPVGSIVNGDWDARLGRFTWKQHLAPTFLPSKPLPAENSRFDHPPYNTFEIQYGIDDRVEFGVICNPFICDPSMGPSISFPKTTELSLAFEENTLAPKAFIHAIAPGGNVYLQALNEKEVMVGLGAKPLVLAPYGRFDFFFRTEGQSLSCDVFLEPDAR